MKSFLKCFVVFFGVSCAHVSLATERSGFYLPDSLHEFSFTYRSVNNLIILPVIVNDSITLNLILDTGCRNLVLFGKRFDKLFVQAPNRVVEFSGMGSGKSIRGGLSLDNVVSMGEIIGNRIPIVVVPDRSIFKSYMKIDGIIGYDIFTRFEIEFVPSQKRITFRPASNVNLHVGYTTIPIIVTDSKPIINSIITLNDQVIERDLLIDTGSTLGLLIKSSDSALSTSTNTIGRGLNGNINGMQTMVKNLNLRTLELTDLQTGIIHSPWHNHASIGMDVLKDYAIILNYVQSYAALKKIM